MIINLKKLRCTRRPVLEVMSLARGCRSASIERMEEKPVHPAAEGVAVGPLQERGATLAEPLRNREIILCG